MTLTYVSQLFAKGPQQERHPVHRQPTDPSQNRAHLDDRFTEKGMVLMKNQTRERKVIFQTNLNIMPEGGTVEALMSAARGPKAMTNILPAVGTCL